MKEISMTVLLILLFMTTFLAVVVSNKYCYYCTALFWLTLYALYMTTVITNGALMIVTMLLFITLMLLSITIGFVYEQYKR